MTKTSRVYGDLFHRAGTDGIGEMEPVFLQKELPMSRSSRLRLGVVKGEQLNDADIPLPLAVGLRIDVDGLPDLDLEMSEDQLAAYQCAAGGFIGVTITAAGDPILVPDLLGLRPLYFSGAYVSDRFLGLVDTLLSIGNRLEFDPESVVHFLEYGYAEPGRTLITSIDRTRPGEALVLRDGRFQRLALNPATLVADARGAATVNSVAGMTSRAMIEQIGEHLKAILRRIDRPTSADLTGGVDSRILASLAAGNPNITEAACSHHDAHGSEITLGRAVADQLGLAYHFTAAPDAMDRDGMMAAFDYVDAHGPLLKAHRHRIMQQERAQRGVEVSISGEGGASYKEFWWLQDFPFYRKRPDIGKLIRLRINAIPLKDDVLGDDFRRVLPIVKDKYKLRLNNMVKDLNNTQAYDQIYYFERMSSISVPFVGGGSLLGIAVVMPLLNRMDVGRAFRLARRHRVLNFAYRLLLAHSRHPEIGGIRTTEGTSLRPGLRGILLDMGPWCRNKVVRLVKKVLQKTIGVTFFESTPNRPEAEDDLLRLLATEAVLDSLKGHGIVRPDIDDVAVFGGRRLQFWACVGLLAKRLDDAARW